MAVACFTYLLFIFILLSYLVIQEHRADLKIEGLTVRVGEAENGKRELDLVLDSHALSWTVALGERGGESLLYFVFIDFILSNVYNAN